MTYTTPGGSDPLNAPSTEPTAISEAAEKAKQVARHQINRLAGDLQAKVGEAKTAAARRTDAAKDEAADQFAQTARALDTAAGELAEGAPQNHLLHQAADGLMRISDAIRGRDLNEVTAELSAFGRRNPLAFLGGAALAGFALARFAGAGGEPDLRPPDLRPTEPAQVPRPAELPGSMGDV